MSTLAVIEVTYEKRYVRRTSDAGQGQGSDSAGTAVSVNCVLLSYIFTFMLPCIVRDFFLNNQPDALIIQILFCYNTLNVWAIFSAHHHELSTVHSALVSFMQVSDDRFQAESGL